MQERQDRGLFLLGAILRGCAVDGGPEEFVLFGVEALDLEFFKVPLFNNDLVKDKFLVNVGRIIFSSSILFV